MYFNDTYISCIPTKYKYNFSQKDELLFNLIGLYADEHIVKV
jgi:hypothetical protein